MFTFEGQTDDYGTFINDVPCFLAISDLPTYLVLLYNVPFLGLSWTPLPTLIRDVINEHSQIQILGPANTKYCKINFSMTHDFGSYLCLLHIFITTVRQKNEIFIKALKLSIFWCQKFRRNLHPLQCMFTFANTSKRGILRQPFDLQPLFQKSGSANWYFFQVKEKWNSANSDAISVLCLIFRFIRKNELREFCDKHKQSVQTVISQPNYEKGDVKCIST